MVILYLDDIHTVPHVVTFLNTGIYILASLQTRNAALALYIHNQSTFNRS